MVPGRNLMVQESKAKQARSDPAQATYIGICTGLLQRGQRDDLEGVGATAVGGQHGEEVDDLLGQPEQHDRPQRDGVPPPELVQLLAAPRHMNGNHCIASPAGMLLFNSSRLSCSAISWLRYCVPPPELVQLPRHTER